MFSSVFPAITKLGMIYVQTDDNTLVQIATICYQQRIYYSKQ